MIDKRTKIALLGVCLLAVLACRGQGIPADGQKQVFWQVDAELPDTVVPGRLVDLSDAVALRQIDAHYRIYGDTLVSRTADGHKTWFAIRTEGVAMVGANSRAEQLALSEGALYLPGDLPGLLDARADSAKVSPCGEDPRFTGAGSSVSVGAAGGFVFADGDTVASTLMVCSSYADAYGMFESRRWYAPGLTFPVVTVETASAGGGTQRSVLLCPPSEQPQADGPRRAASRGGKNGGDWQRLWSRALAGEGGKIDFSMASGELPEGARLDVGDMVRLSGAAEGCDLSLAPLMVCDAAGRVLARGSGEASLGRMPTGCYIAAFAAGGKSYAIKFWIK